MAEKKSLLRRIFRRSIWENASTVLILLGVFMLMQPLLCGCIHILLSLFWWELSDL